MKQSRGVALANGVFLSWVAAAVLATLPHEVSAQERKGFWIGGNARRW